MSLPPTPTPVVYPVNDTSRSEAEREFLQQLTDFAAKQDLTQDLRGYVRDVTIAFTVFAGVLVALRFLARYRQAARVGLDDWLMVAAFVVLVGNMAMNLVLIQMGLGLHSGALTLSELQKMYETLVGAEIIYVTGVNLYKLSLLCFYFRIFPVRSVRLGGYICGGLSTAWNIACILAATWQCTPRERLWMPWLDGTCINLFLTQLCISVPSILCDIAILCLPLPHVMRLKTNMVQRILLLFIFLLGSYVVFTSIYRFRIYLDYTTDDVPWSLADPCAWNIIEISSGIVSACLPTLGPLVRDLWKSAWPSTTGGSKSALSQPKAKGGSAIITIGGTGGRKAHGSNPLNSKGSHWDRLAETDDEPSHSRDDLELVPKHMAGRVHVTVHASPTRGGGRPGRRRSDQERDIERDAIIAPDDDFPMDVIRQRTDVEWRVEERRAPVP
ncbi:hypothetical protein C8A01DRAFT_31424 [Parachaetomium inaequale]|uniref:Rhodopsin domain-containing protein n=1 Tax=Parachaetomium inaequale TaxID=2588326 RepID=A0AAN6PSA7_9PEZI|nr:hypothetical protein C8A01DRAFT_31424 [Parachaetomium inaequale]